MPDTIVPVVRRPVRRVSATPDPKDLSSDVRKLSIGEDSSRAPERLRKTWNAETGRRGSEIEITRNSTTPPKEQPKKIEPRAPSVRAEAEEDKATLSQTASRQQAPKSAHSGFPAGDRAKLPTLPVSRNRPIKTSKDLELERGVLKWLELVAGKKPQAESFERWIQDGTVVAKAMISISFNSVPLEVVNCNWGANPVGARVKCVIHEMRRFGVSDVFEPEDMMELKNIPRVTKALARLLRLAAADSKNDDMKSMARNLPFF